MGFLTQKLIFDCQFRRSFAISYFLSLIRNRPEILNVDSIPIETIISFSSFILSVW